LEEESWFNFFKIGFFLGLVEDIV